MFTSSISPDQHLCVPGCGGFMASRGPAGPHTFAWFVWWLTTLLSMSILNSLCKALSVCHCNPKQSSLSLFVLSAFFLGSWNWIFFIISDFDSRHMSLWIVTNSFIIAYSGFTTVPEALQHVARYCCASSDRVNVTNESQMLFC